jgi:putative tricarboxylic transport membrane protein
MSLNIRASTGEIIAGAALLAVGLAFAVMAGWLPATTDPGVPGPGGMPFALGIAIAGLGSIIGIKGLVASGGTIVLAERKALISVALLCACLVMLEAAGFMLASFLFLFFGFWLIGDADWRASVAAAAIAAGGLWLMFTKALGVGLPYGALIETLFR